MDESTRVLGGVPDAARNTKVVIKVTLERSVSRLDEGRLRWGQELVKELAAEKVGSATQRFRMAVGPEFKARARVGLPSKKFAENSG